jgi:hypothetical protein
VASRIGLAALLATGVALAWTVQPPGMMQNSHYALVKALAHGTPHLDRSVRELGDLSTRETVRHDGHLYSIKAPGLAAAAAPTYRLLEAAGVRTTGDPQTMLWVLALVVCVVPALVLLVLVAWAGDRVVPGFGLPAAVTLGVGTLVLPFAPLLLSHVLVATMLFGAFALLWHEREGGQRLVLVAAAGLLAGAAVVVEYPAGMATAILGLYAVYRSHALRRAAVYGAAALAGVAPLLAYNAWAFGSPLRLSYQVNFGAERASDLATGAHPSASVLVKLVFGDTGLLRLSPVLALGVVGLVLIARRGARAEALVAVAVVCGFLVYASSYGASFGGFGPGPRYVVPALPFLAFPLAASFRRFPVVTSALAVVSAATMTAIVATGTLGGYDTLWFERLGDRAIVTTAAGFVGVTGWYTVLPLFAAVATALGLALWAVAVAFRES